MGIQLKGAPIAAEFLIQEDNMRRLKYSCRRISLTGVLLLVLTFAINGWGPWTVQTHAENLLTIGLLAEPKSLNIWFAGDRWSRKILDRI